MSSKTRGGSSKGFSEEDLQAILATLPTSPKLASPQEICQLLQEWHSKYSGLAKNKRKKLAENTRALEVQTALRKIELALTEIDYTILKLEIENIIDLKRIHEMARIVDDRFNQRLSAFSQAATTRPMNHLVKLMQDLQPIFEPPSDFFAKGPAEKTMEREGIRALARIYWHATKRKPTVTKVINSGDRSGPYFEFATAVISRVWRGQQPTSLIEEMGREIGMDLDTFLSQ